MDGVRNLAALYVSAGHYSSVIPKGPETPNVLSACGDHLRSDWQARNGHPIMMVSQVGYWMAANKRGQSR